MNIGSRSIRTQVFFKAHVTSCCSPYLCENSAGNDALTTSRTDNWLTAEIVYHQTAPSTEIFHGGYGMFQLELATWLLQTLNRLYHIHQSCQFRSWWRLAAKRHGIHKRIKRITPKAYSRVAACTPQRSSSGRSYSWAGEMATRLHRRPRLNKTPRQEQTGWLLRLFWLR